MEPNLIICNASAGSGKTFALVKEYLKILVANPRAYRNTLAITFTNKATEEMKSRIIGELSDMAKGKPTTMGDFIAEEMKRLDKNFTIAQFAEKALKNILHDYSNFSVMTIDSFFQWVIRSFSRELKIPLSMGVELDTEKVLEDATLRLLEDVGKDKVLTEWLEKFVLKRMDDDRSWELEKDIKELGREIFKEHFFSLEPPKAASEIDSLVNELQKICATFENKLKNIATKALQLIDDFGLEPSDFSSSTVPNFFKKFTPKLNPDAFKSTATVTKWLGGEENPYPKRLQGSQLEKMQACIDGGLYDCAAEIFTYKGEHWQRYISCKEVLKNIYVLGILSQLRAKAKEYEQRENVILISETAFLLNELIALEDVPFILEKVGTRFQHILLDEFQDTSNLQWKNVLPLVKNILSEGGKVFVVGDAKQSIYRWRGGNMELIVNQIFEDLHPSPVYKAILDTNYRSQGNIIEFNNLFFTEAVQYFQDEDVQTALHDIYEGINQKPSIKTITNSGFVRVEFLEKEGDNEEEEEESYFLNAQSLQKTLSIIRDLISKEKRYDLKDIAILVRRRSDGSDMAKYLMNKGIKVISDESLLFKNDPGVRLLLYALQYIANPFDALVYTKLLDLLNEKDGLKVDSDIVFQNYRSCHELLPENEKGKNKWKPGELILDQKHPFLSRKNLSKLRFKPLYELLEALVNEFQFQPDSDPFITQFFDQVMEFTTAKGQTLSEFLEWWETNKNRKSLLVPTGENAVSIMTIHQSKGLEFPIVIMPWAEWSYIPKWDNTIWSSTGEDPFSIIGKLPLNTTKSLEESWFADDYLQEKSLTVSDSLNMLYVAFTRAKDGLFVFGKKNKNKTYTTGDLIPKALARMATGKGRWVIENELFEWGDYATLKGSNLPVDMESNSQKMEIKNERRNIPGLKKQRFSNQQTGFGNILHEALAKVQSLGDITSVLDNLVFEGKIKMEEKPDIEKDIREILDDPLLKSWQERHFKPLYERELVYGDQLLRPDKLLVLDKACIVIDYKTGQEEVKNIEQVKRYIKALEASGYTAKGYLLYISGQKKWVEVDA